MAKDYVVNLGTGTLLEVRGRAIRVGVRRRCLWIPIKVIDRHSEIFGFDVKGARQTVGEQGKVLVKEWWADRNRDLDGDYEEVPYVETKLS